MISQAEYLCVHAEAAARCWKCREWLGQITFAEDPENPGMKLSFGRYRQMFREGKRPQEELRALPSKP